MTSTTKTKPSTSGVEPHQITVGVDTHLDFHVAVALDERGRRVGELSVTSNPAGYRQLVAWAEGLGQVSGIAIEGTGSYGAGLSRHLQRRGVAVMEADRPDRSDRRARGKTDSYDAETAARAMLAQRLRTRPKTADGATESLRMLRIARRGALKARMQADQAMKSVVVTAPDDLREQLRGLSAVRIAGIAERFRPGDADTTTAAAKLTLRSLARRRSALVEEVALLDVQIDRLVTRAAPALLALPHVGPQVAAALLVAAGDNPGRLRTEASFAHMAGVAPVPASSGKTQRHRLNRSGNRDANNALWTVALGRMHRHEPTKIYVARRLEEGRTRREIIRCLKRYIAREIYHVLQQTADVSAANYQPAAPVTTTPTG